MFNLYAKPLEAYQRSFVAAGRSFRILERTPETKQEDFIEFITAEIDQGRPVIALGIIGPPEACIIAGYQDDGRTLLGWSFFQDNPEFASEVKIHESGYFLSTSWWKNPSTIALMSFSEERGGSVPTQEILENAITVMTTQQVREYAGGPKAYDAWAKALADESQFREEAVLPLLYERLMCHGDAMDMISEGRYYAAQFLKASFTGTGHEVAEVFSEEAKLVSKMVEILGGWQRGEEQARALARTSIRQELVKIIMEAKELDRKACTMLRALL